MIYETKAHRDDEGDAAWMVEHATGYRITQTSTTVAFDWIISSKGKLHAVGELKVRSKLWDSIAVDVKKIDALLKWGEMLDATPLFFLGYREKEDGPMSVRVVKPAEHRLGWNKGHMTLNCPRERNDVGDPVYYIPLEQFKLID